MTKKIGIVIYIDGEIEEWLAEKSMKGYKKASLIRHILHKQIDYEKKERSRQQEPGQPGILR